MAAVFEHDGKTPLAAGETDGMEQFMADVREPTSTDWDLAVENPPHPGWRGELPYPVNPPAPLAKAQPLLLFRPK